ncbi:MAG: co-chaperone GroES [Nitrospirae bacterium]|nr:co-chaperone GroES [Candidatus Troglogloeales bacterium]
MSIKPLQDWVVVDQDEAEESYSGGIIIPDSAKEAPHQGKVIAIGEGKFVSEEQSKGRGRKKEKDAEKKFVKTTLKPGDHILYEQYAVREIEVDGERTVLVREEDVLGLLV